MLFLDLLSDSWTRVPILWGKHQYDYFTISSVSANPLLFDEICCFDIETCAYPRKKIKILKKQQRIWWISLWRDWLSSERFWWYFFASSHCIMLNAESFIIIIIISHPFSHCLMRLILLTGLVSQCSLNASDSIGMLIDIWCQQCTRRIPWLSLADKCVQYGLFLKA